MIYLPGQDLKEFNLALANDDVDAMRVALDAAAARLGIASWREFGVAGRSAFGGLLWEAAEHGAQACFLALVDHLYALDGWDDIPEGERKQRSIQFATPLFVLAAKLPDLGSQARFMEKAFLAFFAKDGAQAVSALEELRRRLPEWMKGAAAQAALERDAEFQREALEAASKAANAAASGRRL